MAFYQYKALKSDGGIAQGDLEAGGRQDAFRKIESLGLKPIRLTEKQESGGNTAASGKGFSWGSGKVTFKMLENFTRLLSSLLAAGVPLSRALVILYREAVSPAAGEKWKAVHDLVVDGLSLANAMSRFPET
ncbi:MAG: type II secretion system F family protein, partial [Verrucomicrobiota bacterium]